MHPRRRDLAGLLLAAAWASGCARRGAPTPPPERSPESDWLAAEVAAARAAHDLPALAVFVGHDGAVVAEAADGVRAIDAPERATLADRWHIGSCGKAMTATLLARLVERGAAGWDSPVEALLPDLAPEMDPAARAITLTQLLSMTAGLPENPSYAESYEQTLADIVAIEDAAPTPRAQRRLVAERLLASAPLTPPGSTFAYSNTGYIIAGAIAEQLADAPYEELLGREVLHPLGLRDFGFGAPGRDVVVDQPRGHGVEDGPYRVWSPGERWADNPRYYAPAGGMNITLRDWAGFAVEHARGDLGMGTLLSGETYATLHTPAIADGVYALGWGALVEDGRRTLLTHNGSNGLWFADIRIYPQSGYVFLMATNDGREEVAPAALRETRAALVERYAPA